MTNHIALNDKDRSSAAEELAELHTQVDGARAELTQLQKALVEMQDAHTQFAELREANEHLVVAAIRAHASADSATQELGKLSRHGHLDPLTNLPNRTVLLSRFNEACRDAKHQHSHMGLLFIDLDAFKQINDTLGHAIGDEILRLTASRLALAVRDIDTVSRYGGDEFLVLLANVSATETADIATKLITAVHAPCSIDGRELLVTASIGISMYPADGENAEVLIDRADAAMYRAKRQRLGSFSFHSDAPKTVSPIKGPSPESVGARTPPTSVSAEERQSDLLREANERLVLAALSAHDLYDAAERSVRRQADFIAVIAHELRNPLGPLSAAATLLGRGQPDEAGIIRIQAIIERQVTHMSRLVSDLLDVSRASTGKLRLEHGVVDVMPTIDEAADSCRPSIEKRRQHLAIDKHKVPLAIVGDPVRLMQIVSNLLDNAIKYTPEGGHISLSAELVGRSVVITVADDGIGIAPDSLLGIFEPFAQDNRAIDFNDAGLGIGLTVVRELVEAHGGTVTATSAGAGLGSCFIVTIPAHEHPLKAQ